MRHEYVLDLVGGSAPTDPPPPADLVLRTITTNDRRTLAELLLEAYRDTIDDEGEDLDQALDEIDRYFSGADGNMPSTESSYALAHGDRIDSACIVKHWRERACPLVGYIVTAPRRQSQGLARLVLSRSVRALRLAGHAEVRAVITEGNRPSEALFARSGSIRSPARG